MQRVVVYGICSENVRVVSGVLQGSVLGPLLFLLYTSDLPIILENSFVSYADDSYLLAEVPEPGSRVKCQLYYHLVAILLALVIGASVGVC